MNRHASNSNAAKGYIKAVLDKLSPKIMCLIIIFALSMVTVVIGLAVHKGQKVKIWGIDISSCDPDKNSILVADLVTLSPKYFESKYNKEQSINAIRQLVDKANDLENMETNLLYKIALIEIIIPKYGSSINTKIKDKNMVGAYKKIQEILKGIDFYEGDIDGNQQLTYEAVVKFQKSYNEKAKRDIIPPDEYGHFGYYTCWAVGKWSRRTGGGLL